ncbi:MAG: AMP-binding protein [Bacteroidia bacterium]
MNTEQADLILNAWDQGLDQFSVYSSGSTGTPKEIVLERKWMKWSAEQTGKVFDVKPSDKMYCCLPVDKVGGLMMLIRSKVWQIPIQVVEPSSNPLLEAVDASIISLTAYQIHNVLMNPISVEHLKLFRIVLIGGGDISSVLETQIQKLPESCEVYHSYGMSETYSHIALRQMNGRDRSDWFTRFEGIEIQVGDLGNAIIKTPYYTEALSTNDRIELNDKNQFRILGRLDFVINSGAFKQQPEEIERLIQRKLNLPVNFVISSTQDEALGEKLVLVCEDKSSFEKMDFSFLKQLNAFAIPKEIIQVNELPLNSGGKIDRKSVRELINN